MKLTLERLAEIQAKVLDNRADVGVRECVELLEHIATLEAELAALRAERQRDYDALLRYPHGGTITVTSESTRRIPDEDRAL